MAVNRIIKKMGSGLNWIDWQSHESHAPRGAAPVARGSVSAAQPSEEQLRQAHDGGFAEGQLAARQHFEGAIAAAQQKVAHTIAELSLVRSTMSRDAQADLVRLSVAIARRILHRELLVSPDILQGIVSVVLEKLDRQEVYRVRVHPGMAEGVERELKRVAHHRGVQVAADPSLDEGGCVFETSRGNISAGIESQLEEIERGLADHLEA